ncbi:MAG: dihydroorotase [Alphaproteobacteria bacterium]|nr:dihydroorotase [Alphaproteobacteria bacterium]
MTAVVTIRRPDDWHLHLRDGTMLSNVLPYTVERFARAIIMPNLVPPVTTAGAARAYRDRILAAMPRGADFTPLMTGYLTDTIEAEEVARGFKSGAWIAMKLYPAGATTNSHAGVTDIRKIDRVLTTMAEIGMPLLVHGEVVDPDVDVFDREAVFLDRILAPLLDRMPTLRVVFEHVTTAEGVEFVINTPHQVGATITAHHLMINRNAIFQGGIRPHMYCLPIAKRERHRLALRRAATSGNPRFFLGTDSAPHRLRDKENACGCAGIFNAPGALELYAEVFDEDNALDALEAFASLNGPAFYRMPPNEQRISLVNSGTRIPAAVAIEEGEAVIPFRAGETLRWRLVAG